MIPKLLVRTVPRVRTDRMADLWEGAKRLHPGWDFVTLGCDPPSGRRIALVSIEGPCGTETGLGGFPLTDSVWGEVESGAQLADLVRLEFLWRHGGVYIDSDVWCLRPFDSLLGLAGFAGWENPDHVCNAVMGFRAGHPAVKEALRLSVDRVSLGTQVGGVGAFEDVVKGRDDMVLFPPGAFYPVTYHQIHVGHPWGQPDVVLPPVDWDAVPAENPWAFCVHEYAQSWAGERVDG